MTSKINPDDLKKIMGWADEDMQEVMSQLDEGAMNAWMRQLPGIFQGMNLKSSMTIIDMPSGNGRVSIPLAQKYHVKVLGYDIIPAYIRRSNLLAAKRHVKHFCTFKKADIRTVVKKKNVCDLLLWIAAPNLWKDSKKTIKMLRNCVKSGGRILIADAYLYSMAGKRVYPDYKLLDQMNQGYAAFGDKIERFIDYKDTLWTSDYNRCKKSTRTFLQKANDSKSKEVLWRRLRILEKEEISDKKHLGLGIWIIRVMK